MLSNGEVSNCVRLCVRMYVCVFVCLYLATGKTWESHLYGFMCLEIV